MAKVIIVDTTSDEHRGHVDRITDRMLDVLPYPSAEANDAVPIAAALAIYEASQRLAFSAAMTLGGYGLTPDDLHAVSARAAVWTGTKAREAANDDTAEAQAS